jgi:hypothetical protein
LWLFLFTAGREVYPEHPPAFSAVSEGSPASGAKATTKVVAFFVTSGREVYPERPPAFSAVSEGSPASGAKATTKVVAFFVYVWARSYPEHPPAFSAVSEGSPASAPNPTCLWFFLFYGILYLHLIIPHLRTSMMLPIQMILFAAWRSTTIRLEQHK